MNHLRKTLVLAVSLAAALTLSSCGGGGGAGALLSAVTTSLTGMAIDGPLLNSTITITTGAPLYAGGTVQGTITTNASGQFSGSVALPNTSDPVFATVVDSTNSNIVLTSFLGTSSSLYSAGTLTSTSLHELDITPVTTAAVAVYYKIYGYYSTLTPNTYATLIQNYSADILAISAGVKSVGDNLCSPSLPNGYTLGTTASLAEQIASYAGLSSTTASTSVTIAQVGGFLGASCSAYLNNLQTQIQASNVFGPQLLHESNETSLITPVSAAPAYSGSFSLSGLISETGVVVPTTIPAGTYVTNGNNSAAVVSDSAVTISSAGVISSTDGNVSGTLTGTVITLTVKNGSNTYTLTGRITNDVQVASGTAYLVQAAGTGPAENYCSANCSGVAVTSNTSPVLTNFTGVLVTSGATPLWSGGSYSPFTNGATLGGVACGNGTFPLRLSTSGVLPLGMVGECITPAATSWSMAAQTSVVSGTSVVSYSRDGNDYIVSGSSTSTTTNPASFAATSWSEVAGNPFILTAASATYTNSTTTANIAGKAYYVAGSSTIVFVASSAPTSCSGGAGTCNLSPNGLLTLGNNELHAGSTQTISSNGHIEGLGEH